MAGPLAPRPTRPAPIPRSLPERRVSEADNNAGLSHCRPRCRWKNAVFTLRSANRPKLRTPWFAVTLAPLGRLTGNPLTIPRRI